MSLWQPGDSLLVQHVWRGRVFSATPMMVVDDGRDSLVLWCPEGVDARMAWPPAHRGGNFDELPRIEALLDCLLIGDWVHYEQKIQDSSLWFLEPGAAYAIAHFRHGGEPIGWYINLQEPFKRTERGIQTMDLALDVIVAPSGSWRWKDEDEFDALVAHSLIDARTAAWIRSEGWRAIRRLERGLEPFSSAWQDWTPPAEWQLPVLGPNWDSI